MNALTVYGQFDQMQQAAMALHKSGYFTDAKSEAQVVVKVMAGAELGLPPFASMTGIHIIQGRPALGANLLATLIKNHPDYNYRVMELSDKVCRIQFFENGEACGVSEFTIEEARKAGTKNLDRFPKNMLFARAISNGARWYTPGVFGGSPVYTPEELGANVDEDGYVVGEFVETQQPPAATEPEFTPANAATLKALHAAGFAFYGKEWDGKRPELVRAISKGRTSSSNELTPDEAKKLIDGINRKANEAAAAEQATIERNGNGKQEPTHDELVTDLFGEKHAPVMSGAYQE